MENVEQVQQQTQTPSKIDEAKALAERMEKAAAELKAQTDRLEQFKAEQILSGTAGIRPEIKEKTIDDVADEMAMETVKRFTARGSFQAKG